MIINTIIFHFSHPCCLSVLTCLELPWMHHQVVFGERCLLTANCSVILTWKVVKKQFSSGKMNLWSRKKQNQNRMWDNYGHFTHSCCILMTFNENLSLRGDKYYLNHFESLVKKDKNQKYGRGKLLARKNEDQDFKKTTKKNRLLVWRECCLEEKLCLSDLNISLLTHVWDTHTHPVVWR